MLDACGLERALHRDVGELIGCAQRSLDRTCNKTSSASEVSKESFQAKETPHGSPDISNRVVIQSRTVLGLTLLALSSLGCSDDRDDNPATSDDDTEMDAGAGDNGKDPVKPDPDGDDDAGPAKDDTEKLNVRVSQLSPLGGGFEYEGWVVIDGKPVSTGRFNLEEGQEEYSFDIPKENAEAAEAFVLSIEPPAEEDDPAPAKTKILGGVFKEGTAVLGLNFEAALNTDFKEAVGQFFLNISPQPAWCCLSCPTAGCTRAGWWVKMAR